MRKSFGDNSGSMGSGTDWSDGWFDDADDPLCQARGVHLRCSSDRCLRVTVSNERAAYLGIPVILLASPKHAPEGRHATRLSQCFTGLPCFPLCSCCMCSRSRCVVQEAEVHNPMVEMETWAVMEFCNRGTLQAGVDKVRVLPSANSVSTPAALPGSLATSCLGAAV